MRIEKRLEALESRMPAANYAVTLSGCDRPLGEVEDEYIAKHGIDPHRDWFHIRLVGVQPQGGYDGNA